MTEDLGIIDPSEERQKQFVAVILVAVFFFLVLLFLLFVPIKISQKASVPPEEMERIETSQEPVPTAPPYEKGVPQKALNPNLEAGGIKINNSPKAVKMIQLDVSTPVKKQIVEILEETLKEMGYVLLINNQEGISSNLTLPNSSAAAGSFTSGCTKYGFRWEATKGTIEVFFFIDQPQEVCTPDKFIVPVINAVGQAKGQIFEWWKSSLEEISKKQGKEILATDFPIIAK